MKKLVTISTTVYLDVDETKFTPEFMEEFRKHMHPFQTIDDHIAHFAFLETKDMLTGFVEGYGQINEFVREAYIVDGEKEVCDG